MFEENVATSRRLLEESWGTGNLGVVDEVCTEGVVAHDPVMGDIDREGIKRAISGYRDAFPDLTFEVEDAFAAGDNVVIRWSGRGTFENEFMGQAPTGERGAPVRGITIDRYEDGKIAESWGQWDTLAFMRNIGAIPEGAASAAGS